MAWGAGSWLPSYTRARNAVEAPDELLPVGARALPKWWASGMPLYSVFKCTIARLKCSIVACHTASASRTPLQLCSIQILQAATALRVQLLVWDCNMLHKHALHPRTDLS